MSGSFERICVAVDASPASRAALGVALALVVSDGELVLVNAMSRATVVAECSTPFGGDASVALTIFAEQQHELFAEARARCTKRGIRATTRDIDDGAAHGICELLENEPFDAVALGTHARTGLARFFLGSTAAAVVRSARIPVIVTSEQEHARIEDGLRTILVAFDASEPAQAATEFATLLARNARAHLVLAHVREAPAEAERGSIDMLERAYDTALSEKIACDRAELSGPVADAIAAAADARHAELIVIGTHSKTGLTRLRLGSVAERLLETAHVAVMVVPAEAPASLAAVDERAHVVR